MERQDYAARVRNLPLLDGTEPVEEELKKRLEEATGQKVVGVSVPRLNGDGESGSSSLVFMMFLFLITL